MPAQLTVTGGEAGEQSTSGLSPALERELELDFSAADERRLLEHLRSRGAEPFHAAERTA